MCVWDSVCCPSVARHLWQRGRGGITEQVWRPQVSRPSLSLKLFYAHISMHSAKVWAESGSVGWGVESWVCDHWELLYWGATTFKSYYFFHRAHELSAAWLWSQYEERSNLITHILKNTCTSAPTTLLLFFPDNFELQHLFLSICSSSPVFSVLLPSTLFSHFSV